MSSPCWIICCTTYVRTATACAFNASKLKSAGISAATTDITYSSIGTFSISPVASLSTWTKNEGSPSSVFSVSSVILLSLYTPFSFEKFTTIVGIKTIINKLKAI